MQELREAIQRSDRKIELVFVVGIDAATVGLLEHCSVEFRKEGVPFNVRINFGDVQPICKGQGGRIDCAAPDDEEFLLTVGFGQRAACGNGGWHRGEYSCLRRTILPVAAQHDIVAAWQGAPWQTLPGLAPHDDWATARRVFEVDQVILCDDSENAFLLSNAQREIGLVHKMGQNYLTRVLTSENVEKFATRKTELALQLTDFTLPKVSVTIADAYDMDRLSHAFDNLGDV